MNLGQRLTALRNHKHLTQEQVAEAIGVKRARYNAWENTISNPDHFMLAIIAKFHNVTVDFLLGLPHPKGVTMLSSDLYADGYTDESVFEELEVKLENIAKQDDYEIQTIAAHHEGEEWTEEELLTIQQFKEFVKSQRRSEKRQE